MPWKAGLHQWASLTTGFQLGLSNEEHRGRRRGDWIVNPQWGCCQLSVSTTQDLSLGREPLCTAFSLRVSGTCTFSCPLNLRSSNDFPPTSAGSCTILYDILYPSFIFRITLLVSQSTQFEHMISCREHDIYGKEQAYLKTYLKTALSVLPLSWVSLQMRLRITYSYKRNYFLKFFYIYSSFYVLLKVLCKKISLYFWT